MQGELSCDGHQIRVFDFLTQKSTKITASREAPGHFGKGGHGAADYHLIDAFISAVAVSVYKQLWIFFWGYINIGCVLQLFSLYVCM